MGPIEFCEKVEVGMRSTGVPEKHVQLHNAVMRMEEINQAIDTITARITGNPRPKAAPDMTPVPPDMTPVIYPPLLEVLESTPTYIDDTINVIHEKLERLNSMLF